MIRRLFVLGSILASAALLLPGSVRAQSPKIPAKSLIRVAHPGALSMLGMAMPTTFPNTYASTPTMSLNPNVGSKGTLTISYQFTGTTQSSPMCNQGAQHHPKVTVQILKNGATMSQSTASGYNVAPCVQMNQTIAVSFDLGSDQCSLSMLVDGTCTLAEQDDDVLCSVSGQFAFFIKQWELEGATTVSQVVDGSGPYFLEPYCAPSSDPPDWFGPFASDDYGTGYWVATELMQRWQLRGLSFYGVKWTPVLPVGPAGEWTAGSSRPICTMADHGCSFVDQTCTAKLMPMPNIRGDEVWKRENV